MAVVIVGSKQEKKMTYVQSDATVKRKWSNRIDILFLYSIFESLELSPSLVIQLSSTMC